METLIEASPISQEIFIKLVDEFIRKYEIKRDSNSTFTLEATHAFEQFQLYSTSILQIHRMPHSIEQVLKTLHDQLIRLGRFLLRLIKELALQFQLENKKKQNKSDGCCVWCRDNIEAKKIESVQNDLRLMTTLSPTYLFEENKTHPQRLVEITETEMMKEIKSMQRGINERKVLLLRMVEDLEEMKDTLVCQSSKGSQERRQMPLFSYEQYTVDMGKHYYSQLKRIEDKLSSCRITAPKQSDKVCQTTQKTDAKDKKIEQLEEELLRLKSHKSKTEQHMKHWKNQSSQLQAKVKIMTGQIKDLEERLLCETMLKQKFQRQLQNAESMAMSSPSKKLPSKETYSRRDTNSSQIDTEGFSDIEEYDPIVLDVSQEVINRLTHRASLPADFHLYHPAIRQSICQTLKGTFDTMFNDIETHHRRFTYDNSNKMMGMSRIKNKQSKVRQAQEVRNTRDKSESYKAGLSEKQALSSSKRLSNIKRNSSIRMKTEFNSKAPISNFAKHPRRATAVDHSLQIQSQFSIKLCGGFQLSEKKYRYSQMKSDLHGGSKENIRKHLRTSTTNFEVGQLKVGQTGFDLSKNKGDYRRLTKLGHLRNRSQEDLENDRISSKKESILIQTLIPRKISEQVLQGFLMGIFNDSNGSRTSSFWNYKQEKGKNMLKVVLARNQIPFVTNCMALLAKAHLINPPVYEQVRSSLLGEFVEIPSEHQKVLIQESVNRLVIAHRQCSRKGLCSHLNSFLVQLSKAMSDQGC